MGGLDTRSGLVSKLKELVESKESDVDAQLKALKQIADVLGFSGQTDYGDWKTKTNEELNRFVLEVILPALAGYGVKNGQLLSILCQDCLTKLWERFGFDPRPK